MDTKIIEYILTIHRCESVSRAAEELYLTQSALNQQLLKLEKEFGAPLFTRTRNHWQLTDVGRLYVEAGKQIMEIKRQTYSEIQDIAKKWNGTVRIGLTPERGVQMFTAIYPRVHAKYPDAVFQPIETTVAQQVQMLDSGSLDIGFQTIFNEQYKNLIYKKIDEEPFYLIIPRSHHLAGRGGLFGVEPYPVINLREFKDDLFTLVKHSSSMRNMLDSLFDEAGFQPHLLFESVSMRSMQMLAASGQCCAIIPRYYAAPSRNAVYFSLGPRARWEVAAVYARNHHLNAAAREFIRLASEYWKKSPYSYL